MTTVIKSGDSGDVAHVNKDHQLLTSSRIVTSEEHQGTHHEKAFILHAECHTSGTTNGGLLAFKCSEEEQRVFVTRLYIDAHTLSQDIIITQVRNPTVVGGTDISNSITNGGIVNKTFSSGHPLRGVLTVSDGANDMTYTGGNQYHSFNMKSGESKQRDMKGTNILSTNNTILFGWKTADGGNAVDGEIISLSINLFIEANGK